MPDGSDNPYNKGVENGWNYTAQRALEQKKPTLAKQLQAQASQG